MAGRCACTFVPVGLLRHSPVCKVCTMWPATGGHGLLREPVRSTPGRAARPYLVGGLAKHFLRPPSISFPHTDSPNLSRTSILPQITPRVQLLARNDTQAQSRRSGSTWFVPSPSVTTVASGTSSAGFAVLLIPPSPWPWPRLARARAVLLLPPPPAQPSPINSPTPTPLPVHSQCPPHVAVNYLWSCTGEPPQR